LGVDRLPLKIKLDLSRHCIETAIKRLYNQSVSRYFKIGAQKPALEYQIDALKHALEQLDFPQLRSKHSILAGRVEMDIFLEIKADGSMKITSPGEVIRL